MSLLGYRLNLTDLVHGVCRLVNVRVLHRYRVAYSFSIRSITGRLRQLLLVLGHIA